MTTFVDPLVLAVGADPDGFHPESCNHDGPFCPGCGQAAENVKDICAFARSEGVSPAEWVREEEGTYNPANQHFLCDMCFIKVESAVGHRLVGRNGQRWICP